MIYFVSSQKELFDLDFKIVTPEESIELINQFDIVQFDTETSGLDSHLGKLLLMQFGNRKLDMQIVVDATTVNPLLYKEILETKTILGQNLKFDIQWLFNYGIAPRKVVDTMILEQLIYLGFPTFMVGADHEIIKKYSEYMENHPEFKNYRPDVKKRLMYETLPDVAEFIYEHSGTNLKALCYRYLDVEMDKTVRGQIIWRGIDDSVIRYAATDVIYLEDIFDKQKTILKERNELRAAQVECNFVVCNAYYEWCGVKLNVPLWKQKMEEDNKRMNDALNELNDFVISCGNPKFYHFDRQGDLFSGFQEKPESIINWQSTKSLVPFLTYLGFNCKGIDKDTKEEKDSVEASILKPQKEINDAFLKVYFQYTEAAKVVTTYGQNYINAINPVTGRIHTVFRQLGTDTGRLACGSQKINVDLAKLKGLPLTKGKDTTKICAYPQLQNLPKDKLTRSCFMSEDSNDWISIDYSSQESRLMASMSGDKAMIDEYIHGDGDLHSLTAKMCYPKELKDIAVKDIKKFSEKSHNSGGVDFRQQAKNYEFCFNYAGNDSTLVGRYGFNPEFAKSVYDNYMGGFKGLKVFQDTHKRFVVNNGYILISSLTGHRATWWDWSFWKNVQSRYTSAFWEDYRANHKGTGDSIAKGVRVHFKAKTDWEKNSCNSPLQGTGAIIFKIFNRVFFDWILDNGYFNKIKYCIPAHDEINIECPKEITSEVVPLLQKIMSDAGKPFCTAMAMPAEAEVGAFWIH